MEMYQFRVVQNSVNNAIQGTAESADRVVSPVPEGEHTRRQHPRAMLHPPFQERSSKEMKPANYKRSSSSVRLV